MEFSLTECKVNQIDKMCRTYLTNPTPEEKLNVLESGLNSISKVFVL